LYSNIKNLNVEGRSHQLMKKSIHYTIIVLCFLFLLVTQNGMYSSHALFNLPNEKTTEVNDLEKSKKFIEGVVYQVNVFSGEFNTLVLSQVGILDNTTIINETNRYIKNLNDIVENVQNFSASKEYQPIFQAYRNSLIDEIESYKHYSKYLETSNSTENKISIDLLSKAYEYEREANVEFGKLNPQ